MPRIARSLVDNGYYHILTRGNDKRLLFRYKQDYLYFLKIIRRYLAEFEVDILHYCLMPNHLHLLIHARISKDLPKFMQAILQVYANYFRAKYHSTGFIFQNRYKSCTINNDSYLLECARYIERNPLRARITSELSDYQWSSYSFYAEGGASDIIGVANPLYFEFAKTEEDRKNKYKSYILEERPYELIVDEAFKIR